jgi:hypothetical protein
MRKVNRLGSGLICAAIVASSMITDASTLPPARVRRGRPFTSGVSETEAPTIIWREPTRPDCFSRNMRRPFHMLRRQQRPSICSDVREPLPRARPGRIAECRSARSRGWSPTSVTTRVRSTSRRWRRRLWLRGCSTSRPGRRIGRSGSLSGKPFRRSSRSSAPRARTSVRGGY